MPNAEIARGLQVSNTRSVTT
ncbi:hypothetical protein LV779_03795 [Streptomyces thinghirensis]|nr:hypothetical protein [Streptomyces thinghirensis]